MGFKKTRTENCKVEARYVIHPYSYTPQRISVQETTPADFLRIGRVVLHIAKRVIVELLNQLRIDNADKDSFLRKLFDDRKGLTASAFDNSTDIPNDGRKGLRQLLNIRLTLRDSERLSDKAHI